MSAIEAMIYCLGFVHDVAEDGEYHSQTAYDVNGQPHWIAFPVNASSPRLCSECPTPFAASLEPYKI